LPLIRAAPAQGYCFVVVVLLLVPLGETVVLVSVEVEVEGVAGCTTVVLLSVFSCPGVTTVVEEPPPAGGVWTSVSQETSPKAAAAMRRVYFIG
jgi:hypothetical protein